jgi:hypothetical protein
VLVHPRAIDSQPLGDLRRSQQRLDLRRPLEPVPQALNQRTDDPGHDAVRQLAEIIGMHPSRRAHSSALVARADAKRRRARVCAPGLAVFCSLRRSVFAAS